MFSAKKLFAIFPLGGKVCNKMGGGGGGGGGGGVGDF